MKQTLSHPVCLPMYSYLIPRLLQQEEESMREQEEQSQLDAAILEACYILRIGFHLGCSKAHPYESNLAMNYGTMKTTKPLEVG